MQIIRNYNECVQKRLQSSQITNVVTLEESQGVAALASVSHNNDFYLLTINDEICSWYRCRNKFSRLMIIYAKQDLTHNLNGCKDFDLNLKKVIGVNEKKECVIFLDAQSFSEAGRLKTALEKLFAEVKPMPKTDGVDVKNKFCAPEIELRFGENRSMKVSDFFRPVGPFHISLDESTLNQQLIDDQSNKIAGVTVRTIIPDTDPDYKIGDLGIKVVNIRVDVDGYQNVYITVKGSDKKEKITLAYSRYLQKQPTSGGNISVQSTTPTPIKRSTKTKEHINKIVRDQEYSIYTEGDLETEMHGLAGTVIREMRRCIQFMYQVSYPDEFWYEAYRRTISCNDSKLANLEKSESGKLESNLIELIDYQYLITVMNKEKNNILDCWGIGEDDYRKLKDSICELADERNGVCHFKEQITPNKAMAGVAAACTIAQILRFKSYDHLLEKQAKIAKIVYENYTDKNN